MNCLQLQITVNPPLKDTFFSRKVLMLNIMNMGSDIMENKKYKLIGADGKQYLSDTPGTFGGHRKLKIYGRLDCPSALRYIAKGQYVKYRVFFADEATAVAAGYRPCGVCMPEAYKRWKEAQEESKK